MTGRDIARAGVMASARAARRTRATMRGNVVSVADGRVVCRLANGGEITLKSPRLLSLSPGQGVVILRNGSQWEIAHGSAYSGGLGAPTSGT